jgi:hypothetical protein
MVVKCMLHQLPRLQYMFHAIFVPSAMANNKYNFVLMVAPSNCATVYWPFFTEVLVRSDAFHCSFCPWYYFHVQLEFWKPTLWVIWILKHVLWLNQWRKHWVEGGRIMASSLAEEEEAFEDTKLYLLCYCISFVTFLVSNSSPLQVFFPFHQVKQLNFA